MLMVPLQMRDPVLTMMNMEVAQPQMMLMVHQLTMLMVPLQRDPVLHLMTTMMTTLLRFLLMLMLLPRHLHLPMKMLDAAVLVEDLAELLLNKLLVVDVQGILEEGLTRAPPQPHTEDQGGTPLPSDIRHKRLNSKAD